ncbi:MAG: carbohydrate ABC transporter permease [Oscillospiraceae bacterium]|nr:carbohydrate ABC transporter permease [Oscillospiraceae bacterium]
MEALAILIFALFMVPFFLVVLNAAKVSVDIIDNPVSWPKAWGQLFTNIGLILQNSNINYWPSFFSSAIITVCSLAVIVVFSAMAAWVLVRNRAWWSNVIFMMFVAAMVIPFQVVMFPLVTWFRQIEVVTGIRLLRQYLGMIFAYLGFGSSMSVFIFHGFIKGVPLELEEASTIDGCSRPATFFRIVFPILQPVIVTVLILNGIWVWNDYLLPLMILGSGNMAGAVRTLPLAVQSFVGSYVKQWDLILTATLMAMLPIIVLYLFAQKYIIKGMVEGSIK